MENTESRIVSEEPPTERSAFVTNEHIERFFHFARLAGLNFVRILFGIALAVLLVFSAYRLIMTYRIFSVLGRFISSGTPSVFSTLPHFFWVWLLALVASWASLTAFFGRRI